MISITKDMYKIFRYSCDHLQRKIPCNLLQGSVDSSTLQQVARYLKTIAPNITNLALSWKTFSSYFIKPYYGPLDGDANGASQNGDTGRSHDDTGNEC